MSQNQQPLKPPFNVNWITADNFTGRNSNWNLAGSNASLNNQTQSSSNFDLRNNNNNNNNMGNQERERLKAFLPGYRPAPDYETAIRQKYQTTDSELLRLQQSSRVASDPHMNAYTGSHPDVHQVAAIADAIFGQQLQLQRIPDVTRTASTIQQQPNASPLDGLSQQLQMMRINKRAPLYPANRVSSTSTPDLATASHRALSHHHQYVTGSSPDLLSTRTFSNSPYPTSQLQPSIPSNALRYRHLQSHNGNVNSTNLLSQAYEGAYRANNYQQQQGLIGSSHRLSGSIEPIYENQIYQSQTDVTNGKMRDRASSIQSAARYKKQQQLQSAHIPPITAQSNPGQYPVLQNSQSLESINQVSRTSNPANNEQSRLNRRLAQFDSINRSQSTNVLDTSTTSDTDGTEHRNTKEKKRPRWKFWGGKGKSSLNEKPKSGPLGWYKDKTSKTTLTKEEEMNSRHRWSTGLPRLPLQTTVSKEKLCQLLEAKLDDPQLYVEFERIPKRKADARYECALHEENRTENFDPSFLPYDENRVRLTPTRENRLGYYNASYVTATVGSTQRFYIVAQSPHAVPALSTFLQCVWEADVYLIVQLSNEVDYVPPTSDKCLDYGQYQIWKEFAEVTDRCITSKLRLYHTASRRYRSVWHLSCCDWGEQNCPKDIGQFLEFVEELRSVRLASINEVSPGHNKNPPVMIHCIEGGGRSGVTLAADLLLYTLDNNQALDIPRVLGQLREQRDNIVPSLAQYKFVYALLINYLKRSRLI